MRYRLNFDAFVAQNFKYALSVRVRRSFVAHNPKYQNTR